MDLMLRGDDFAHRMRTVFKGELPSHSFEGRCYHRILIPGMTGGENQWALIGVIGQAMRTRGAEVTALMCDALLPACTLRKIDHHESACTRWCYKHSGLFAEAVGLPYRWYSQYVSKDRMMSIRHEVETISREDLLKHSHQGIELGELLQRSLESHYKLGALDLGEPDVEQKARDFTAAACALVEIADQAMDELEIDKVLLDDGGKIDWGVFRAVARRKGIPVDVIGVGIRGTSIRFEVDCPPANTAIMAGWETWKKQPLTQEQNQLLDSYLVRRECVPYEYRDSDWQASLTDATNLADILGISNRDPQSLVFSMFPNVGFDAGKTKGATAAFPTAQSWVQATVKAIARFPDHHLLIKQHPAEHHRESRDSSLDGLGDLPPNIHVIPGSTEVTASAVARLSDIVLTYTSTVTAEAAALGCPVILAGGGWHSGRGIAFEVKSPQEYHQLIVRICTGEFMPSVDRELARRYAWALFFRNDIPVTHLRRNNLNITDICIESADDLAPGVNPSIDAICRGVLCGEPFENPEFQCQAVAASEM
ncbi:MAG: hypothetical protein IH984_01580 [Planctomycetes bacterium]|nr:hypothetical protein [Planctomycetota bacterium]